jgi:predicted DNA-binding WGR domain protein
MAETIYICSENQSNKFWSYEQNGSSVTFKWGRVGRDAETLTKDFGSDYGAQREIEKKIKEKTKKGYKLIDEKKLQQETETAKDLGTKYKIKRLLWVNKEGDTLNQLDQYDAKKFVYVEVIDSYSKGEAVGQKAITRLLLSKTESFVLDDGLTEIGRSFTINGLRATAGEAARFSTAVRKILRRMSEVVAEALKTVKFASLGKRKLFDDDDSATSSVPEVESVLSKIDSAGFERGVINKFASLGQRVLDL